MVLGLFFKCYTASGIKLITPLQFSDAIDLTPDNKDDLQAVIALSLLESPEIQAVERDANRSMNLHIVFSSLLLYGPRGFMLSAFLSTVKQMLFIQLKCA